MPSISQIVCAVCQTPVLDAEPRMACPSCGTLYHAECWRENGGCGIYGCSQVPQTEPRSATEIPASYWGRDTKACPVCNREILAAALRCRFCGASFSSARPQAFTEFQDHAVQANRLPSLRNWVVVAFILSVLPCTAPFGAIAALVLRLARGRDFKALPSVYGMLAILAIVLGLGQVVIYVLAAALTLFVS